MAKHLQLTNNQTERWNLPDDSDLDEVRLEVGNAVRTGSVVSITVEIGGEEQTPLLINGKSVTVCAVYEHRGPDPWVSFS